jgi:uncharacterized membrane protein YgaE (UPF0421/DUF939 family)
LSAPVTASSASLTAHSSPTRARLRNVWVDRFLGSDPGLNRFRNALHSILTIGIILEAELVFVHFTHALQIGVTGTQSPQVAAATAAANHEFLVIAMLLGAIIGMISTFSVMDQTARGQLVSMLFLPVPMIPALALGLVLSSHRTPSLVVLALILSIGTYCRRFGPRGFVAGLLLFLGYFLGFFLGAAVGIGDIGWLVAEIGVGLVVALAVRFLLFYPRPSRALARTQRSYVVRARKIVMLALTLFDDPGHTERDIRRLHHHLARLNEAALMIDAQLGDPNAVAEGSSGQLLHQRLFDGEVALTNIARFAQALARLNLPESPRSEVRLALEAVVQRDAASVYAHATNLKGLLHVDANDRVTVVIVHRFADSVIAWADAMTEWLALGQSDSGKGTFQPAVALFGGWLPGSAQVSAAASLESGRGWTGRIRLAPYTRTAIQMGVAAGGAIAIGVVLSSYRFYWALIAVFVTFMGANNSAEQVRKALFRVGGTIVGIGIGSLLVRAVGHSTGWTIAVVLIALFFGLYLVRINYAFMVVGVTVMVSQLYEQLGEFSNSLLLLRLEETSLGAGVAIIVVLFVLPLHTRRVLRVAMRDYVQAITELIDHAASRLLRDSPSIEQSLRADARDVDASYQALIATAQPLLHGGFGRFDEGIDRALRVANASRYYGRNLIIDVVGAGSLDEENCRDLERAVRTFHESLNAVSDATTGSRHATYTRSASLFDSVERRLDKGATVALGDGELAVRDLKLLDGAMVQLAEVMGLDVTDLDTAIAQ